MTKDRYLEMMDQLGQDPVPEEIPPDYEDFPMVVIDAINAYNAMGDRIYPEIGYIGKDYTNLPHFLKAYKIEDEEFFLQILAHLDAAAVEASQKKLKAEYDKIKRKHG